jgi:ABC-type transporter Mla subunit MlaD
MGETLEDGTTVELNDALDSANRFTDRAGNPDDEIDGFDEDSLD